MYMCVLKLYFCVQIQLPGENMSFYSVFSLKLSIESNESYYVRKQNHTPKTDSVK